MSRAIEVSTFSREVAIDRAALESYVDVTSALIGLPIAAESRPLVVEHLARVLASAPLLAEFALPEGLEAAPVFAP